MEEIWTANPISWVHQGKLSRGPILAYPFQAQGRLQFFFGGMEAPVSQCRQGFRGGLAGDQGLDHAPTGEATISVMTESSLMLASSSVFWIRCTWLLRSRTNCFRVRSRRDIEVIDDDLGRSATGTVARPGFEKLLAWLCPGEVGAVLCLDASRLARNGRDWHHLLELCGLVEARVRTAG